MTPKLKRYADKWRKKINKALDFYLPSENKSLQDKILKAMRYSIFAGGKRLRPILVIAGAETCGLSGEKAMPTACALELVHTYSLIHDDLPAMDDDCLRRGFPTSHIVFGEGMAILAGDSLLTYAFDLIAKNGKILDSGPASIPEVTHIVAECAGFSGMVGGQVVDLEMGEGKWMKQPPKKQIEILKMIHECKTSALIKASVTAGAVLAGASRKEVNHLAEYGRDIGMAFQIADDILDLVGDKKLLGKKGSDIKNKKLTYPAIYGIERSKEHARHLITAAKDSLKIFGSRAVILSELADYIVNRTH